MGRLFFRRDQLPAKGVYPIQLFYRRQNTSPATRKRNPRNHARPLRQPMAGITNYSYNNPGHPLSATNIHGLLAVENQLWVGTFNKGIDVLDIPSGKIIKHYSRENSQTNLNSNFILCFYKTRENELLVGTSNGLMIYNKQTESFSPWNNIYALIRQIYQDSRGDIWVATSNGIYHYLRKENKVEQYRSGSNQYDLRIRRFKRPDLGYHSKRPLPFQRRGTVF